MDKLKQLIGDARRHLDEAEGIALHDLGRIRDALDAALSALHSSQPVEPLQDAETVAEAVEAEPDADEPVKVETAPKRAQKAKKS